jgi:DeoR/GlpR family transcriptional regulator of sugar metabolism
MIGEERRALILKKLSENRYVQVSDLAEEFEVTTVTIRRDLDEIEAEGLCIRKRGGAIRVNPGVTMEMPYDIKRLEMVAEKERIARTALDLIDDGDTFILDAGSTTYALALLLNTKIQITVVTNDLKIAVKLAENPKINLICTGGVARTSVFSLQGAVAESFIRNIKVDKTFMGADAIHADGTISNVNIEEVSIKQAMIKAADQTILLADSSKFMNSGFFKVCDLSDIDLIITDDGISEKTRELIISKNARSIIV